MAFKLPAFALFPLASWREQLLPDEWVECLDSWLALIDSHLSLPQNDFNSISTKDESLSTFLTSFIRETALGGVGILGPSQSAKRLLKDVFLLIAQLLRSTSPPSGLVEWEFLADFSRVYGKKAEAPLSQLSSSAQIQLDASLAGLKKFLVKNLDAGIQGGDLRAIEEKLDRVGDLIHASPSVAGFFLAGDDFLDGLISCFKIMNPPLRKVIILTNYLCLVGLVEGQKTSALTDVLYSLKNAGAAHKAGPLNVNDSLVAELVTSTPILQQIQRKLEDSGNTSTRTKSILAELATFRKLGAGMPKPKRLVKRKIDKGKGLAEHDEAQIQQEIHIHRMSQISQIQDLFPELGSGFISKLFDEYTDDTEQVISHLLEGSLPAHLQSADRTEQLSQTTPHRNLAPRSTPPLGPTTSVPIRHNIFDDDELDRLAVDTTRLQLGKRNLDADALLADRAAAPDKAAILSALAAFDSDDDERDDTYDAADVGGTVDAAGGEDDQALAEGIEAALFRVWTAMPKLFERDAAMRKNLDRARLRDETGMTDEQIEGWAVILARDERLRKRLQVRYGEWTGAQTAIESTAWRAGIAGEDGDEESDGVGSGSGAGGPPRGGGRGGGRGRGRGGRGGGRGGAPTPPDSEQARRKKEANKASRANHNRRDQRARKMARGGLPG
ncbi:hypothetical protein B0T14DRAFT_325780 [Immersiella caudata]|uniref:CUE domain-containing protein n=1 Tax=Immersiella caudata TaxID=314043 RepID=A0AA39TL42_9PEZI|nr:hypothetical protein B0T14DRAFT_325780 [Immersiella caudata]